MTEEIPSLDAMAKALILRTGRLFSAHRYTIELWIDDVRTEIHAHARNRRQADKVSMWLIENAAELLIDAGVMGDMYDTLNFNRTHPALPPVDSVIYLKTDIGQYEAGTPLWVIESEWTSEIQDLDYNWPVTAVPIEDQEKTGFKIPLTVHEFTTEAPNA